MWHVHHPESMKIPRRKQAVPRWKRVTEGRRPKDRSVKGGSLVSPGLASQRDRFLTAKQGRYASSTPLLLDAQMPWGGHPLCGRPAGYLPSGTVASCHLTMADCAQGRRPENRPGVKRTTWTPGWHPEETEALPARRDTLKPAWSASTHSEGKGAEDPGASSIAQRGNCRLQSVRVEFLFPLVNRLGWCAIFGGTTAKTTPPCRQAPKPRGGHP